MRINDLDHDEVEKDNEGTLLQLYLVFQLTETWLLSLEVFFFFSCQAGGEVCLAEGMVMTV